jgi:hypothetical protein
LDSVRGAHRAGGRPQHPVPQRWFDEAAKYNPGTFGLAGASLSIGRNGGSAVSSDYPAPYPFTGGTITQVVVDISGEPYENLEKKLAIAFAKD